MQKNTKKIIIFLIIAFILVIGVTFAANTNSPATSAPHETTNPAAKNYKSYTLAEVAAHKDATNCWAIVGNSVYDLTAWISQHPGGSEAIKSICGKDGTVAFTQQHGEEKEPEDVLKTFYIGVYAK